MESLTEKQKWVNQMRLMFSKRTDEFQVLTANIIHEDGTLNQDYFRPPIHIADNASSRKWTSHHRQKLIAGIVKFGLNFRQISLECGLSDWTAHDLRLKTQRLMGRQNLSHYKKDWKGGESEISTEYKRNMEIGLALGQWKGGMLVFDDEGKVLEAITTSTPTSTSLDKRKL